MRIVFVVGQSPNAGRVEPCSTAAARTVARLFGHHRGQLGVVLRRWVVVGACRLVARFAHASKIARSAPGAKGDHDEPLRTAADRAGKTCWLEKSFALTLVDFWFLRGVHPRVPIPRLAHGKDKKKY